MSVRLNTAATLLAAGLAISSCGRSPDWNVLIVTFDTTRADKIGAYGNEKIQTPNLDRLASEGVLFENAYSAIPLTTPSHSTIMTGKYPLAHGVRDNGQFVLGPEQVTLAEMLSERGYATGAAIASFPLVRRFGVDQGFEFFDDRLPGPTQDLDGNPIPRKRSLFFDERRAAQVNEAAFPWLEENHSGPFFLWLHYFDPHQPFVPPPPYDHLYADDPYSGEIAYADACFGTVIDRLEELGVYDRTLIVVSGDHGEGRGDHNELTHAILAYNSTLRIPLIMRVPGGTPRIVSERVGTVDIAATVLDLLGLDAPQENQGRSLDPLIEGSVPADWNRWPHYAENLSTRITHFWGELRVLFADDYKYIHGPRPELFDLKNDPRELQNLADSRTEVAEAMRKRLASFINENAMGTSIPQEMTAEMIERLRALGYIQTSIGEREQIVEELRSDGLAPQDRVVDINHVSRAKGLLYNENYREARRYIDKLLAADPDNPFYLELYVSSALGLGEIDEAWEALNRVRAAYSAEALPERVLLQTVAIRFVRGDETGALEMLEASQEGRPTPQSQHLLANMYSLQGRFDESRAALRRALEARPEYAPARIELAVLEAQQGETVAAEQNFQRVLYDEPYQPRAHYNYGAFLVEEGRLAEAETSLRRAVELWPRYLQAYHALVVVQLTLGDLGAAQASLGRLERLAPESSATIEARRMVEAAS